MLWAGYILGILILFVVGQVIRSSWIQRSKLSELSSKCADLSILHVLIETEFGLVQDAVDCVSRLMDNANCPTQLAVHVLEPVTSVKAVDIFGPELERACKLGNNFSHYFKENVFIHKVHRTRNLSGFSAMKYLLDHLQKTLRKSDIVMWIPSNARFTLGWDTGIRNDFVELKKKQGHILSYPLLPMPSSHRDIERFFLSEQRPTPSFFALRDDLVFESLPMSRPGVTPSIGLSLKHPVASTADILYNITETETNTDLALSLGVFSLGYHIFHGSASLAFKMPHLSVSNRRLNLQEIFRVKEDVEDEIFQEWLTNMALQITEDSDMILYGRAYMGMTIESTLQEILVKYGSEASFETEKEALKYG
jgi:hypothetical protein